MIGRVIAGPGETFVVEGPPKSGAFGDVYPARGTSTGRLVAVKFVRAASLPDGDERRALLNELALAPKVEHPNVVRALYAKVNDLDDVGPYLIAEWIAGRTLSEVIPELRGPKAADRALHLVRGIAAGVQAISRHLVHRDIKPDNILVTDDDIPKITDFGISKVLDAATRPESFKGGQHLLYMAPEGWEMAPNTSKLDVYSVGLVFYEVLTQEHPLRAAVTNASDWRAWRDAHLFGAPSLALQARGDLSLGVRQLLPRMIAKRAADRPAWDEVTRILNAESDTPAGQRSALLTRAAEAAAKKRQAAEASRAAGDAAQAALEQRRRLYGHSCEAFISLVDDRVAEFNDLYQGGKIERSGTSQSGRDGALRVRYALPTGPDELVINFFDQPDAPIELVGSKLLGAGYFGSPSSSVNILLVREGDGDLYGRWIAYAMRLQGALRDPRSLMAEFDIKSVPFGFSRAEQFWDEMRHVNAFHVFTYERLEDIASVVERVLHSAITGPDGSTDL